jgi:hypothetical protein
VRRDALLDHLRDQEQRRLPRSNPEAMVATIRRTPCLRSLSRHAQAAR